MDKEYRRWRVYLMFIHPEFRPVLDSLPVLDVFADLEGSRVAVAAAAEAVSPVPGVRVEERKITAADGRIQTVRIYSPTAASSSPRPAALWFHGGAFAIGAPNAEEGHCLRLSAGLDMVVVAPDYRLAPENPYPAGFDDCHAALIWTAEHADELGIDVSRIALGGHSAGAALATSVALATRERGGPAVAFLYLGYPVLDDRQDTPSSRTVTDDRLWNRSGALDMWSAYLAGTDPEAGYAVPARARDLSGLPPTYIMVCGADPGRDEGLAFGAALTAAGVPVEMHLVPGAPHMFDVYIPQSAVARRAVADWTRALAEGLGQGTATRASD
ncbi:alpha/beta hydrolase [Streptomyces sp. NPDC046977]|uniref:alpha/beta hydrolase n=1 Tax=Streptomyces sp. NPDC046977 TaxID=3154703 RepID=UPI0033C004A2